VGCASSHQHQGYARASHQAGKTLSRHFLSPLFSKGAARTRRKSLQGELQQPVHDVIEKIADLRAEIFPDPGAL
jgi:hypothetical protein